MIWNEGLKINSYILYASRTLYSSFEESHYSIENMNYVKVISWNRIQIEQ